MEFHLQENLTARRNGRNFSTTVNCAAERFCMLLPKKMSIFINTVDFIIDLKFTKRDATVITLKLPKKIFFPRKSKWFFVLFLWARNMKDFELMLLNCGTGEDSWQSLGCKEIKPVNPKGNQPWVFTGRTDAETEAPILWPLNMKSQLIGKDPDAGKDWRQKEKGVVEDEMVR